MDRPISVGYPGTSYRPSPKFQVGFLSPLASRGDVHLSRNAENSADAVVEGRLGDDGVFHATFVMAKCPSKYEGATDFEQYREAGTQARSETTP